MGGLLSVGCDHRILFNLDFVDLKTDLQDLISILLKPSFTWLFSMFSHFLAKEFLRKVTNP